MRTSIGEFEELVLLTVGILYQDAYGLAITDELERQTKRKATISSVHKALVRLEEKGFLKSFMGGATDARGGRNKRLYELTTSGKKCLQQSKELRNSMWNAIPEMIWQTK
ncbi:MAG: helix-turn-helix transcriptional regulator [Reichenbachiella sp.]|uniref:PadR family transcriptional regulator n=1 Tax=Reichenbachiella sp. TaxID=2184521 RepID=UPI0032631E75